MDLIISHKCSYAACASVCALFTSTSYRNLHGNAVDLFPFVAYHPTFKIWTVWRRHFPVSISQVPPNPQIIYPSPSPAHHPAHPSNISGFPYPVPIYSPVSIQPSDCPSTSYLPQPSNRSGFLAPVPSYSSAPIHPLYIPPIYYPPPPPNRIGFPAPVPLYSPVPIHPLYCPTVYYPPQPYVKDFEHINVRKDSAAASAKNKKKGSDTRWTGRTDKQGYSHPWLLTTLKGHTGQVLDMDFSSNGKYLASCADEEPDPGGDQSNGDGGSSGSECNKENSRPSSADQSPRVVKPLSRRQRKNRRREDGSSPETKKKAKPKPKVELANGNAGGKKQLAVEPLANFARLGITERDLYRFLRSYLLSPEQMLTLSYPVESTMYQGRAIVFKSPIEVPSYTRSNYKHNKSETQATVLDANAREFSPYFYWHQQNVENENSSGHGSGNSSDSGENLEDSEESSDSLEQPIEAKTYQQVLVNPAAKPTLVYTEQRAYSNTAYEKNEPAKDGCTKKCMRCDSEFRMTDECKYVTQDSCEYHWGRLQKVIRPCEEKHFPNYGYNSEYACCGGKKDSRGCTKGKLHVWSGLVTGFNGPYDSYVRTRTRKTPPSDSNYGIYALDCEMCFTAFGLELTKVTVVGSDGRLVYDTFVRPDNEIVDYNTRFSGISPKDLNRKRTLKTLREVQNDLMGFINADTILIGHGLENDLRALRIIHATVVDTAVTFPHYNGLPYRRSLKSLTSSFLKREVQTGSNGHNSCEDARACMDLMLWRVRKDFRSILDLPCHTC